MDQQNVTKAGANGPFHWQRLTVFPAWISNHSHYKVWDEIAYPFLKFNGTIVEV